MTKAKIFTTTLSTASPAKKSQTILMIIIILIYFLSGCSKTVYVPVHSSTIITEVVRDTVIDIRLETIRDSVTVADTISRLENKYACSVAQWSAGMLSHSLATKPVDIPVQIQYKEVIRIDSIAVPYPVIEIKEVNRQKKWQKVFMNFGIIAFAASCCWLLFKFLWRFKW